MPKPSGGKFAIKGTRLDDSIVVGDSGYTINGSFKPLAGTQIDAGLKINGDAGFDTIIGGRGADEISGGRDNDTLIGGAGFDKLMGGDGNDTLIDLDILLRDDDPATGPDVTALNASRGAFFDGGRGIDTIDFTGATQSMWVDLGGAVVVDPSYSDGANGTGDWYIDPNQWLENRIINVENLIGGSGNDGLWGNAADNEIHGGGGHDNITGGVSGDDRLFGDAGNDYLYGSSGHDELTGGSGIDRFLFGDTNTIDGHDIIWDYTPDVDFLSFMYEPGPTNWSPTTYNGVASIIGSYEGGASSIIVVGIADPAQLTIETGFLV